VTARRGSEEAVAWLWSAGGSTALVPMASGGGPPELTKNGALGLDSRWVLAMELARTTGKPMESTARSRRARSAVCHGAW